MGIWLQTTMDPLPRLPSRLPPMSQQEAHWVIRMLSHCPWPILLHLLMSTLGQLRQSVNFLPIKQQCGCTCKTCCCTTVPHPCMLQIQWLCTRTHPTQGRRINSIECQHLYMHPPSKHWTFLPHFKAAILVRAAVGMVMGAALGVVPVTVDMVPIYLEILDKGWVQFLSQVEKYNLRMFHTHQQWPLQRPHTTTLPPPSRILTNGMFVIHAALTTRINTPWQHAQLIGA